MVYSASGSLNLLARQAEALLLGGVAAVIFSRIDYHRLRRPIIVGGLLTWGLLLTVLIIGDTRWNAARSILFGSVQPSELAKPVLVIYLAFWLSSKQDILHKINFGLIPMGAIIGTTAVLIILQPDFSAAFTLFVMGILLFFLAGGKLQHQYHHHLTRTALACRVERPDARTRTDQTLVGRYCARRAVWGGHWQIRFTVDWAAGAFT
jgi:cell division protein FtsW (lipid II flippase)